jgi:hypothetical protein
MSRRRLLSGFRTRLHTRKPGLAVYLWFAAAWVGWSDGRCGLPLVPQVTQDGGLPPASSPFRDKIEQLVLEARQRRLADLAGYQHQTLVEIHARAMRVAEPGSDPRLEWVEKQRFIAALTRWKNAVDVQRPEVEALTHWGNALINRYWSVVQRYHPAFAGQAEIQRQVWGDQTSSSGEPFNGGTAGGWHPNHLALPSLAEWKPKPIDQDDDWGSPGALLILLADQFPRGYGALDEALRRITLSPP